MSLTRKHKNKVARTRKKAKSSGHQHPRYLPNKSVKPGNDFYRHINYSWLKKTKIPPTKVTFGVSEEVEKKIENQTTSLLEKWIQKSKQAPSTKYLESTEQLMGTLAESVIQADKQTKPLQTLQYILSSIQTLNSKEEIGVIVGEFTKYKIRSILPVYGQYENKNQTRFTYTFGVGGLGLPDSSYYLRSSLQRRSQLAAYKQLIRRLETLFKIPGLSCVVKLEKILAAVVWQTNKDTIEYEKTGNQLQEEFRYIPFESFFQTLGLSSWKQTTFFVESMRWLHTCNKLFHHLGLDYWKLLLCHQIILYSLPWLPPPYSNLSFALFRRKLRGQQHMLPRKKQAIYVLQQYASIFFSRLYVEEIVDPTIKPKVKQMVETLLTFAEKRVATLEWLEPKTREKAQEKIKKMRAIVAYPDHFDEYTLPKLQEDNILVNLLVLGEWQTNYEIQKLGEPISKRKDWDDSVFVVNAYYYGQANEMVIPSGILNYPFYDKDKSFAWNFGGIGSIMCHELTHAFDKEGKEYDPDGQQKKWWTANDNRNYNKQTKSIKELYGKQKVNGFPVSGKRTLSENIADIGGMGIALDALKHSLDEQRMTEKERKQAYREFFTAYAVSWRFKDKPKKRIQALIMDKHAPPFLRVNLVVSQYQEWYDAFDIKPEDKLYIPPEKRISIF